MANPFLPLLLIIFISFPLPLISVLTSPVDPFTSGVATIQYWNHKVPSTATHPADFLLPLLSPLSVSLTSSLISSSNSTSTLSISPSLCTSARLLCPNVTFTQQYNNNNNTRRNGGVCYIYVVVRCARLGAFFRQSELREGNVIPMPRTNNKTTFSTPSFLPRPIADIIPFEADAVKSLFRLEPDTLLAQAVDETVQDCLLPPKQGEIKRCITSAESMIDFAVEILGSDIVVRSTDSEHGSGGPVMIGKVKGLNGGKMTNTVSCHQALFPYLVYYCHSISKVKVYEAEILSVETKRKLNQGVFICHLDTSTWSAKHPAFAEVGGKPGEIEVCHWIFDGDMTWVVADK